MKRVVVLMILLIITVISSIFASENEKYTPEKEKTKTDSSEKKKTETDSYAVRIKTIEMEINQMLEDKSFYYGIGTADIGEEYSKALQVAKENALQELSRAICTEVSTDMKQTLSNTSTLSEKKYSEQEIEIIEQKSRIYTDVVLSNIQDGKMYDDYPRKGVITYIVKKSVREYDEQIKTEFKNNKQMISEIIKTGRNEFHAGKFLNAIHNWTLAKETIQNIFGELPLFHDINGDGFDEEMTAYLNENVIDFFTNIEISLADNMKIFYDAQGNITKNPILIARYTDKSGTQLPIASLPLKISVIEGKASFPREIETGNYGQIELLIKKIDASYTSSVLKIEIDLDRINKTALFSLPVLSSLAVPIQKLKTIAVSLTFSNNGNISSPPNLLSSLKSSILAKGFSVTEVFFPKEKMTSQEIDDVKRSNADYFLNIYIATSNAQTVGGYQNMFNADCTGSISLYQLPLGEIVATEPLTLEKGFGSSASSAGSNAYGKVESSTKNKVEKILSKL